ncbi:MAG TPA: AAA domain-containing protein, partial [Candidatus Nitrosotalea sp.]|nr:AAA domain-containing protein [Candidatus Nitrosotalea sp.]
MQNSPLDKNGEKLAYRLKQFKNKAEKVDSRDISIFLRKIIERKSFDLSVLENFDNLAKNISELILKNKKNVCVIKSSESTDTAIQNSGKLRTLYRTTNFIQDETGQYPLFLGFPFIEGFLHDGITYVRAPLLLFPVTLGLEKIKKPDGWYVHQDQERTPTVNKALFSFFKSKGYTEFPEDLEDKCTELLDKISEIDLPDFQTKFILGLYDILDSFSLRYNKDFQEKIESFTPIKKEDIVKLEKNGLHIKNGIILGIFQQGNSAISADYDTLIKKALDGQDEQGIIDDLLEAPSDANQWDSSSSNEAEEMDLDKIPDRDINTILPSDSSQDEVLLASQTQECTVVRGPPGTGKSQVIANLITNALSKNQRVLVVCQKRAALDVVAQRLEKEGLGEYISLIEDSNRDKSILYRRLSRFLESDVSKHEALQSILDANFTSNDIDKLIEKQSSLVRALSKPYFGGVTIHQLYVSITTNYIPKLNLRGIAEKITVNELDQLLSIIPLIQNNSIRFGVVNYPWFFRKDLTNFSPLEQRQFLENLDRLLILSEKKMYDMNVQKLSTFDTSINILKTKTGFFNSFSKERKEAAQFVESTLQRKLEKNENFDQITEKIQSELHLRDDLEILKSVLQDNFVDSLKSDSLERIHDFIFALKDTSSDIGDIQSLDNAIRDLNEIQKTIVSTCTADFTTHHVSWVQLVKDEVYAHWIDYIQRENPVLQGNPFESYMQQKNRLRELLLNKRILLKKKLISELQLKIRSIPKYKRNKSPEEISWSKFTADVSKQRKLKPLRRLFEEYRDVLLSVAPCWLMTPQAVSEVFPLERHLFDLIVYDEASQCTVEEAIPSLYRGKRIVIAGDEKQLRPFDLFRIKDETDEHDEDEPITSESLFILSKRFYNFRSLNWHYRSKSQALIDFSNHAFYEGRLQVAPDVIRNPKQIPIRWINANGTWQNNINFVEAVRVVDEIKNILQQNVSRYPQPSIGIITFNEKQQIAIQDEIDKRRSEDPEFDQIYNLAKNPLSKKKDDEIFIKNIENVQGDERDIIIFSIAYAKDYEGKL